MSSTNLRSVQEGGQALGVLDRADVTCDQQVHESRHDFDHIELKVRSVREQAFVRGVVAESANAIPQRKLVGVKVEALDTFGQVSTLAIQEIDQSFESDSQEHASRPWGRTGNGLSLFERDSNRFRHVLGGLDAAIDGPNVLIVDSDRYSLAVDTPKNGEATCVVGIHKVLGGNEFSPLESGFELKAFEVQRSTHGIHNGKDHKQGRNPAVRATECF